MHVKQIIKPTCTLHTAIFVTFRIGFKPELHIHHNGTTTQPTKTILFCNKKHKISFSVFKFSVSECYQNRQASTIFEP